MRHPQLRTRPPTDDAVLPGHATAPDRRHEGESGDSRGAGGTLIHHAAPRAISPLVVAMIETALRTLLVAPAGRPHAGQTALGPARRRAVDVSSIAGRTNAERLCTPSAGAHPKRRFHEAAAPSTRPRPSAARSGRMMTTGSACRSVESVTRAWRSCSRSSPRSAEHTLSQPAQRYRRRLPNRRPCLISP